MRGQPGFFDIDDRLKRLSDLGDQLEAFRSAVDFELFRPELTAVLSYTNRTEGGAATLRPGADVPFGGRYTRSISASTSLGQPRLSPPACGIFAAGERVASAPPEFSDCAPAVVSWDPRKASFFFLLASCR
jgi:hypothetical protein